MNVFGVLVAYQPYVPSLIENLAIILPQVDWLLVINNGKDALDEIMHSPRIKQWSHWQLWQSPTNDGISRAYNRGVQEAIRKNSQYVIFFDQDSRIDPAMVQVLIADHVDLRNDGIAVAGVGPWYQHSMTKERAHVYIMVSSYRKKYHDYEKSPNSTEEVSFLISSGTLFSMEAIKTVGKMDENLFVDHVDTDWFIRAGKIGYQSFVSRNTTMFHCLGSSSFRPPFLKKTIAIHNANRYRENFKNTIYLYKKHSDQLGWIISDLVRFWGLLAIHLLRLDFPSILQSMIGTVEGLRMSTQTKPVEWNNDSR